MSKKKITKEEYLQLQGIFYLGRQASEKWQEYERAIESMLGYEKNSGTLFGDALICGDKTVDEVMKIEGITIKRR